MDSFQQFLEDLHQMPLEEQMQSFRHEAYRPLGMAIAYAELLKIKTMDCPNLDEEAGEWFESLLKMLDEIHQLLGALGVPKED
jgi:hypothetical protein